MYSFFVSSSSCVQFSYTVLPVYSPSTQFYLRTVFLLTVLLVYSAVLFVYNSPDSFTLGTFTLIHCTPLPITCRLNAFIPDWQVLNLELVNMWAQAKVDQGNTGKGRGGRSSE